MISIMDLDSACYGPQALIVYSHHIPSAGGKLHVSGQLSWGRLREACRPICTKRPDQPAATQHLLTFVQEEMLTYPGT